MLGALFLENISIIWDVYRLCHLNSPHSSSRYIHQVSGIALLKDHPLRINPYCPYQAEGQSSLVNFVKKSMFCK